MDRHAVPALISGTGDATPAMLPSELLATVRRAFAQRSPSDVANRGITGEEAHGASSSLLAGGGPENLLLADIPLWQVVAMQWFAESLSTERRANE